MTDDPIELHTGEALAVLQALPDDYCEALITDPPYSSGGMTRGDRARGTRAKYVNHTTAHEIPDFAGDTRDSRAYGYWCALWLAEALRVCVEGSVACLFTDWRQLPTTTDALQAGGWVWRGIVPWHKPASRPTQGRYSNECEYVVWGTNGPRPFEANEGRTLPGFYQVSAPRDREHQTQKPVEVMRGLVQVVPMGARVLDPFMGAGTTGVASIIERRRFVGIERDRHFATVAERRIREAAGHQVDRNDQGALALEAAEEIRVDAQLPPRAAEGAP